MQPTSSSSYFDRGFLEYVSCKNLSLDKLPNREPVNELIEFDMSEDGPHTNHNEIFVTYTHC